MKKLVLLALLGVVLSTSLMGCNTMHGAGQDISNTGENLKDAVR